MSKLLPAEVTILLQCPRLPTFRVRSFSRNLLHLLYIHVSKCALSIHWKPLVPSHFLTWGGGVWTWSYNMSEKLAPMLTAPWGKQAFSCCLWTESSLLLGEPSRTNANVQFHHCLFELMTQLMIPKHHPRIINNVLISCKRQSGLQTQRQPWDCTTLSHHGSWEGIRKPGPMPSWT